ncbi:hypothetical protein SUGI_0296410 [Cryptomeria japonica]|nr:hypothetical protein SUGI_0296410 [Cryptomeria japonica]
MGLRHVLYVPEFRANMGLLTALVERWHSETCTFHLPMGEMIVTLEDVYRILQIPGDTGVGCGLGRSTGDTGDTTHQICLGTMHAGTPLLGATSVCVSWISGIGLRGDIATDDIDMVIWRPYLGCEQWEDDAVELPYTFQSRYLIGQTPYVLERQLVDRVGRQFGRIQRMPRGSGMYARTIRDQA